VYNIAFTALAAGYVPFSLVFLSVVILKTPRSFHKYVWMYALTFGMLAYCFNPVYEIDLSRYFGQLDYCRTIPFSRALSWRDDGLIIKNLVFWLVSKTGDNHILPLLSVGIVYGVAGFVSVSALDERKSDLWKLLLFQVMLLPMYNIVSNVRNVAAFSLLIWAAYRDLVNKKRDMLTLALYILPCFIHMTGFVLVLFRISLVLLKKQPYIGLLLTLGIPSASISLYENVGRPDLPGNIGKIISRAIFKSYASTVNSSEYAVRTREGGYFNFSRLLMFVICGIVLYMILSQLRDAECRYREYKLFCGLLCAITLIWVVLGTVKYWVFAFAVVVSCGPVLADFRRDRRIKKWMKQLFRLVIPLCMCIRVLLELYYIRRRVDFIDLSVNVLTTSIYVVIGKMLLYFMV